MATETAGAADEVFHPAGDDEHWCESGWFGFAIPERDINADDGDNEPVNLPDGTRARRAPTRTRTARAA